MNGVENDSVHTRQAVVLNGWQYGFNITRDRCFQIALHVEACTARRRPVDNAESRCRRRNICVIIIIITKRNYAAAVVALRARVVRNGEILGWR